MKILVSTDTSCQIDFELLQKHNISVFPLNVIIDEVEYFDGVTIKQDKLCELMRNGSSIKTSTPAYGSIIEYFDNLFEQGYDHIIHFTISSKLSSMNSLFKNIAEEEYNNKITVIDSYSLSTVMLGHVLLAYEEVKKGTDIKEIIEKIEKRKEDNDVVFIPENLNALKNGGRVPPALAIIANTIGIKPMIILKDGELAKDKMIKNTKNALSEKLNDFVNKYSTNDYDYAITHFDCKEKTYDAVYEQLKDLIGEEKIIKANVPINVCAHCGPGTIGILVTPKINGKSIKDYM